jgi:hypothetical protein
LRSLFRSAIAAIKETSMKNVLALQKLTSSPDDPWALSSLLSIWCDCDGGGKPPV